MPPQVHNEEGPNTSLRRGLHQTPIWEVADVRQHSAGHVERGPFEMVPHWLLEHGISGNAIKLYLILRRYGNEERPSWPKRTTLAKVMVASPSTVDRARDELVEVGALCYINRKSDDGDWTSNLYHVHWEQITGCGYLTRGGRAPQVGDLSSPVTIRPPQTVDGAPPVVDGPPPVMNKVRPNESDLANLDLMNDSSANDEPPNSVRESVVPLSSVTSLIDDGFTEFWQTYPRRTGKGAAKKAWERALKRASAQTIIVAALRFSHDPNREDAFTPHPATWLNEDRWEDDPLPQRITGTRAEARTQQTRNLLTWAAAQDDMALEIEA